MIEAEMWCRAVQLGLDKINRRSEYTLHGNTKYPRGCMAVMNHRTRTVGAAVLLFYFMTETDARMDGIYP